MHNRLSAALTSIVVLSLFAIVIDASDNYTVNNAASLDITAHTVCRDVTNNSATGASVYVPTESALEWESFYTNPPAGVTAGSCATTVTITADRSNVNLCTLAGNPTAPGDYIFVIESGVDVYSTNTSNAALVTGSCWPTGTTLTVINKGRIYGKGGKGGDGSDANSSNPPSPQAGAAGGPAISMSYPLSINNSSGYIYGGGGGGGGGGASYGKGASTGGNGGGGGASGPSSSAGGAGGSSQNTSAGVKGASGTTSGGGAGGEKGIYGMGGDGGAFGASGTKGGTGSGGSHPGANGGAAGKAIDMNNRALTWLGGNTSSRVKGSVSN
ncbi:hypothetical protein JNK62_01445 [bacterium]|nr:hypothetical protein [bacterium]